MTGTYICAPNFVPLPNFTGINANVSQIQGKGVIVTGGNGIGPLVCDGETQTWTITDIWANFGSGPQGGTPATWKGGRATVNVNGNASNGDTCVWPECFMIGTNVDAVIRIH